LVIKVFTKSLSENAAFNKGVEYFSEIVFLYGLLLGMTLYELRKSQASSMKQKETMLKNEKLAKAQEAEIVELQRLLVASAESKQLA